jgi:hypothetical protein
MGLIPYVVAWATLAVIVLALLLTRNLMVLTRNLIALHEDGSLHLAEDKLHNQKAFYLRIHRIDRWGEVLTVIAGAGGLVIAAIFIYQVVQSIYQVVQSH